MAASAEDDGRKRLSERQQARLVPAAAADERHDEIHVAWQAAQEQLLVGGGLTDPRIP